MCQNYLQSFFASFQIIEVEQCLHSEAHSIILKMNDQLLQDIFFKEVENAIYHMNSLGFLGPDRFPVVFFQHHWKIVAQGAFVAVIEAFTLDSCTFDLNDTCLNS